jgi:outer membrane lipoprotein SlyB
MRAPRRVPWVTGFTFAAAMTLGAALAAAQPPPPPMPTASSGNAAAPKSGAAASSDACDQCGKVLSIRHTMVKEQWTPLGGGASFDSDARAATMFQIGPGLSNQGKVMVGAAGGAAYQKSPNAYEKPRWEVTVKMDNGQTRVTSLAYEPYVQEGDRVRLLGRNVELIE